MSRRLGVVLALSGLLKLWLAFAVGDLVPRYDEAEFLRLGQAIADGGAPNEFRAPGYQSFLALGLKLGGGDVIGVRLLQVLLSTLTIWIVYRWGRRAVGERVAFAASAFLAFYPSHVAFSHLLWAETLFLFLVMFAFERLLAAEESGGRGAVAAAGVLLGLAALVRSMGLVLLAASAAWLLWRALRRNGPLAAWRRPALLGLVGALVIAPWSIFASTKAGEFVLIDTNGPWNLYQGYNPHIPAGLGSTWALGLPVMNGSEEARALGVARRGLPPDLVHARPEGDFRIDLNQRRDADRPELADLGAHYRQVARETWRSHPVSVLTRAPLKLATWWSPDFFVARHLVRDWYGERSPGLVALLLVLTIVAAGVPLLLGPVGLVTARAGSAGAAGGAWRGLALTWLGMAALVHGILFGVSRMHQPYVPLLVVAAFAFVTSRPVRVSAVGAIAVALPILAWIVSAPAVAGVYLAPGPRHLGVARAVGTIGEFPLPAARHATWAAAEAEAGAGREGDARRRLAESRHAGHPWSVLQRVLLTDDPEERIALFRSVPAGEGGYLQLRLRDALRRVRADR